MIIDEASEADDDDSSFSSWYPLTPLGRTRHKRKMEEPVSSRGFPKRKRSFLDQELPDDNYSR